MRRITVPESITALDSLTIVETTCRARPMDCGFVCTSDVTPQLASSKVLRAGTCQQLTLTFESRYLSPEGGTVRLTVLELRSTPPHSAPQANSSQTSAFL